MLACVQSAALRGVEGRCVCVEVHVSSGIPGFTVVGLPDEVCRESRDRVRAALLSSSLPWPLRRITVNLAPSGRRKGGAGLDLPIAIGLLAAADEITEKSTRGIAFIGELGLDGSVRSVPGILALVDAVKERVVVVSPSAVAEATAVPDRDVRAVGSLAELVAMLRGHRAWPPPSIGRTPLAVVNTALAARSHRRGGNDVATVRRPHAGHHDSHRVDLATVRGQRLGRRALEVAASGGHHLLLVGPPGSGKTMLARGLAGILPPLEATEAMEVARIRSVAGVVDPDNVVDVVPPLRAPHHNASVVSLVGGGSSWMRPGEISLAHHGVLFLDELGEFQVGAIEALRQPLEEGIIRISRARASVTFPASFLLVAAMNPCPCGEGGAPGACRCSPSAVARYARRLSGPLLDRFDIRIPIIRPTAEQLLSRASGEPSHAVAARVATARRLAVETRGTLNSSLPDTELDQWAPMTQRAEALLSRKLVSGELSARGMVRIRRVARTLADLEGVEGEIEEVHVAEAFDLRRGLGVLVPEMAA